LCKYIKKHNVNVYLMGYYFGKNENVALSVDRANYVEWRLQQCGIRPERINPAGHGYKELSQGGKPGDLRKVDITISGNAPAVQPQKKPTQIDIANLKKDESITLDNIHFLPGSHKITSASEVALFHLYIVMKDHPNLKIRLEGHICCLQNTTHDGYDYDTQEYRLSENRAKAVYDYLVSKGIDKERMEYKGFGISEPLAWPERSLADENKNRRVEIRVTDK
ncbi:MAG TPA: OmpA family protein, partial [Flavipsychrobacter sp.]